MRLMPPRGRRRGDARSHRLWLSPSPQHVSHPLCRSAVSSSAAGCCIVFHRHVLPIGLINISLYLEMPFSFPLLVLAACWPRMPWTCFLYEVAFRILQSPLSSGCPGCRLEFFHRTWANFPFPRGRVTNPFLCSSAFGLLLCLKHVKHPLMASYPCLGYKNQKMSSA